MRGPAVNLVVLAVLVLFVGIQQRARPMSRNRLWFAGWVCVFLSMVLWEISLPQPLLDRWRDAARFDFILLAQLLFVMSFVSLAPRLWRVALLGSIIGVPAVMAFDTQMIFRIPVAFLVLAVVLWQVYGVYGMRILMPKHWRTQRRLILCVCVGYGSAFVVHLLWAKNLDLQDWVLAELVLCSAVLYGAENPRRTLASILGTVGFVLWASFYLLSGGMALGMLPGHLHLVGVFWDIPKILIALSMLLQMAEDAHNEKERQANLYRDLYEDFHLVFERNPHPMWIYSELTSHILTANHAAIKAYGYREWELQTMDVRDLLAARSAEIQTDRPAAAASVLGHTVRLRHRLKDRREVTVDVTEHRMFFQGEAARFVVAVDVTEVERESRELLYRAHHDALTGLPNRRELDDRIDACLLRSGRENRMAALLTIDVDHFKQINDTYGHRVGDECLKTVAARLQSRIRQVDTLARSGGEEFTAIIGALHCAEDAHKIAAMLLGIFAKPIKFAELEIFVTISIGVALFPDDSSDREMLKLRSDEALYEAKRSGRNRAVFATPGREPLSLAAGTEELPVA